MSIVDDTINWTEYEAFCKYVTYIENKKFKTDQDKLIEPYLRSIAKRLHDSYFNEKYGGGVSGVIA